MTQSWSAKDKNKRHRVFVISRKNQILNSFCDYENCFEDFPILTKCGFFVDKQGNVWISCLYESAIKIYSPKGELLKTIDISEGSDEFIRLKPGQRCNGKKTGVLEKNHIERLINVNNLFVLVGLFIPKNGSFAWDIISMDGTILHRKLPEKYDYNFLYRCGGDGKDALLLSEDKPFSDSIGIQTNPSVHILALKPQYKTLQ
jgi:hypothetical protein